MSSPTSDSHPDGERLPHTTPDMTGPYIPPGEPTETHDRPVATAIPAQEGACFGDYELIRKVAQGGMGVVFQARHKALNRHVALKMILAGRLATETEVQRFHSPVRFLGEEVVADTPPYPTGGTGCKPPLGESRHAARRRWRGG
jgi:hypothetical protein